LDKNISLQPERLKEELKVIDEASRRAVDLVQQLLTLSRKKEISFEPVDLNNTLKNVLNICNKTFDKSIELKAEFFNSPSMIKGDPALMEQVLLNLCINASHAMTIMKDRDKVPGGVLTIAVAKMSADKYFCNIHPEASEIDYWVMTVKDTGVGMDTKTIAKIFDPFFTTKEKGKGTGLGLSMVYNIVQQHGGFIDVYSELNIGSIFNIYLPCITDTTIVKREAEMQFFQGNGLVLVIDDEPVIQRISKEILENCGYSVLMAMNGEEGVQIYREHYQNIKLVILDLVMPKKSGRETYLDIKKIKPDVNVLLTSGFRHDERVDDLLNMGIKYFIQKPYSLYSLSKSVYEAITQG
jgi:CheY-like chemotaxis protein